MPCTTEILESVDFNAITLPQAAQNDAAQYAKYFRHCALAIVSCGRCVIFISIKYDSRPKLITLTRSQCCSSRKHVARRYDHSERNAINAIREKKNSMWLYRVRVSAESCWDATKTVSLCQKNNEEEEIAAEEKQNNVVDCIDGTLSLEIEVYDWEPQNNLIWKCDTMNYGE